MRKKLVLLYILAAGMLTGCSIGDDGPNFHFTALEITDADLPESFDLNETYVVTVTYVKPDGCTAFEGFDVVKDDVTVRNVVAIGSIRTDRDDCTQDGNELTASFNFTVIHPDPYTFKFYTGDNAEGNAEYLEIIVPVNTP